MWLPESLYEKIPQFWFFAGLFLIFAGLYVGFAFGPTIWYLVLGIVCCLCGIGLFMMRQRYRQKSQPTDRTILADK
ncbi:MAG: hypothetical protein GXP15_03455 [Gammaproteobacteria bacterium]|nr:hypothetical protein [Gammaproteobacteria bacterium]